MRHSSLVNGLICFILFYFIAPLTEGLCHAQSNIVVRSPLQQAYMKGEPSLGYCSPNTNLQSANIHTGNDMPAPAGSPVYALCDGNIAYDNTSKKYWDSFLIVQHDCGGNHLFAYYGHVKNMARNPNKIIAGEQIATIRGDSGNYGNHLHLSVSTGKDWERRDWGYDASCDNIKSRMFQNPSEYLRFSGNIDTEPGHPGSDANSAMTINAGNIYKSIISKDEKAFFVFVAGQTATYVLFSRGHTPKRGELYDNQYNRIAEDANEGEGGNNFRIAKRLLAGQTYYLMVRGDPGSYAIHIEGPEGATISDDHGFSNWSATAVNAGSITKGTIDVVNDQDYFKFTPTRSETYVLFSRGHTSKRGELYDNEFNRIAADGNDGEGGNNFRIAKRLLAGETYYLMVRGDPGNYVVHIEGPEGATVSDDHGFSSWSATEINVGNTIKGTIDVPNDQDYFKFIPKQEATYTIWTRSNRGLSCALHDQDFNLLRSDNGAGVDRSIRIEQKLVGGQTYYIVIRGEQGPYELRVDAH